MKMEISIKYFNFLKNEIKVIKSRLNVIEEMLDLISKENNLDENSSNFFSERIIDEIFAETKKQLDSEPECIKNLLYKDFADSMKDFPSKGEIK